MKIFDKISDSNEGRNHKEAKDKLFDLIIERKISIIDDYNNTYEIYTGKENEFLHIESFIINYTNEAMFSNEDLPCIKYLNFNKEKHNLLCDLKGSCGAFYELPCKRCVSLNLEFYKYSVIGYRPDIAYGFNGKHKIWLEIKDKNECSFKKMKFCIDNDIVLLEIEAKDILNYHPKYTKNIVFKNMNHYYYEKEDKSLCDLFNEINTNVNNIGYFHSKVLKNKLYEIYFDKYERENAFNNLLSSSNLIEVESHEVALYREFRNLIGIDGGNLLVKKDSYDEFNTYRKKEIKKKEEENENNHRKILEGFKNEIIKNKFVYYKEVSKHFNKMYWNNAYKELDKFLKENKFKKIDVTAKNKKLIVKYGIDFNGYKHIIVQEDDYNKIFNIIKGD